MDVKNAERENKGIDDAEDNERDRCCARRQEGRHRICGTQHAIDRPGLTPDLGGEPAGQYGNERKRKAQKYRPEQQAIFLEASFDAQIRSDPGEQQHDETAANHHSKREKRNDYWRPILGWDAIQPHFSRRRTVGVNYAAPRWGKRDREEIAPVLYVRPREEDLRGRLLIVPSRLDRSHLRRLMVNHIFPVQMSEEELDRHEHGSKHKTH